MTSKNFTKRPPFDVMDVYLMLITWRYQIARVEKERGSLAQAEDGRVLGAVTLGDLLPGDKEEQPRCP